MIVEKETLAVVIPVYNEEEIIESVLKEWHQVLSGLDVQFVIRCYNDGSKDDTWSILEKVANELDQIEIVNKTNSGHGPTILKGYIDSFENTWVFQVDSDNEISALEFPRLWNQRSAYDFLIGKRQKDITPLPRRIVSSISQKVISLGFGSQIKDVNSPFRLMRFERLRPFIELIPCDTFAPNLLITGLVSLNKMKYLEIPVTYTVRQTGQVSINRIKLLKVAFRSFIETIRFRIQYKGIGKSEVLNSEG